jgi:hypothetical protein
MTFHNENNDAEKLLRCDVKKIVQSRKPIHEGRGSTTGAVIKLLKNWLSVQS